MQSFIGVDLGWYGKPSGLASLAVQDAELKLRRITRLEEQAEIFEWILCETGDGSAVVAVDAPLVIPNQAGIRTAEREMNRDFRRFHAGCHAANLGRPFAAKVVAFSRHLERIGFRHGAGMRKQQAGRFQIEVHPHAAAVNLFGLSRIVKYKRGRRDARARELARLRRLMRAGLSYAARPFSPALPSVPKTGNLKPAEDKIDAVLCAFIAAHWWRWTTSRNRLYGTEEEGYIVVPDNPAA